MNFDSFLYLSFSILIMLFPVFNSLIKGRLDLFSPPAIFAFGYTASYGIQGWLISIDPDLFSVYSHVFSFDQNNEITAHLLSWVGLILFYVGYYFKPKRKAPLPSKISMPGFKITYFITGLFASLALLSIGWLVYLVGPQVASSLSLWGSTHIFTLLRDALMTSWEDFSLLFHFPVHAGFFGIVAVHAVYVMNKEKAPKNGKSRSAFYIILVTFLVLIILGSRQLSLSFAFSLLLYRHYFIKRISSRNQVSILLLLVLLGGYFGIIQKSLDPTVAERDYRSFPTQMAARLSSSYEQYENLAGVLAVDPPKEWGITFMEDVFYTYIPRAIWPSKPVDFGFIKAQNILFSEYWRLSRSSTYPIGVLGELYLNFGYIGIPLGMFFLGYLLKSIGEWSATSRSFWPPIFVALVANFLAPHRAFGNILLALCLYILFAKILEVLDVFYTRIWSIKKESRQRRYFPLVAK